MAMGFFIFVSRLFEIQIAIWMKQRLEYLVGLAGLDVESFRPFVERRYGPYILLALLSTGLMRLIAVFWFAAVELL